MKNASLISNGLKIKKIRNCTILEMLNSPKFEILFPKICPKLKHLEGLFRFETLYTSDDCLQSLLNFDIPVHAPKSNFC